MQINLPLACFLSIIRPPSIEIETAIFQLTPVDKLKCPFVRDKNDVGFRLYTRHNPTVYQDLAIDDDESLFASHFDFHDPTVMMFHAFLEEPNTGSGIMLREAYILRGDTNVIMVDASRLEAGPWYFTAADNTWYIGRMAAMFIDYMVSRGLSLSKTHLIGHSLGAHSAAVAGATMTSGKVSRITGLDPALPLFNKVSLLQQLDPSDAEFVDAIHTDAGIFGQKRPVGHVDFYPNGGISPQPGCELEVVLSQQLLFNKIFCSHWRSYQFYSESVLRPHSFKASECGSFRDYTRGRFASARTTHMGYATNRKYEEVNCTQPNTHAYYVFHMHPIYRKNRRSVVKKANNHRHGTELNSTDDIIETQIKRFNQQLNRTTRKKSQQHHRVVIGIDIPLSPVQLNSKDFKKFQTMQATERNEFNLSKEQRIRRSIFKKSEQIKNNEYLFRKRRSIFKISAPVDIDEQRLRKRRSIFKNSESFESENFLFRILEFLLRHNKFAYPVTTVVREVNTIVKNGNSVFSNLIKERNNFIGTLPKFQPVTYNFEVPNETKFISFFRKLFGVPIGLTVTSTGK